MCISHPFYINAYQPQPPWWLPFIGSHSSSSHNQCTITCAIWSFKSKANSQWLLINPSLLIDPFLRSFSTSHYHSNGLFWLFSYLIFKMQDHLISLFPLFAVFPISCLVFYTLSLSFFAACQNVVFHSMPESGLWSFLPCGHQWQLPVAPTTNMSHDITPCLHHNKQSSNAAMLPWLP